MKDIVFITGNQHKADYLAKWLGIPVPHRKIDLDEIQSLDLRTVVEHKARQAYDIVKKPVLVEDVALTFTAMGRLPGTLIKWFLEELGAEGLCRLVDGLEHRSAESDIEYALYDGKTMHFFAGKVIGTVAEMPRGSEGFGWNPIFIPEGSAKTFAEMVDDERMPYSHRAAAIAKLLTFLEKS
jgi:non-canonical purine NTP pyrophosphatase (RdgB/HAM1 family)